MDSIPTIVRVSSLVLLVLLRSWCFLLCLCRFIYALDGLFVDALYGFDSWFGLILKTFISVYIWLILIYQSQSEENFQDILRF